MTIKSEQTGRQGARGSLPGGQSSAPQPVASRRVLHALSPDECLGLLEPGGVGRVGFATTEGIIMLPVNFAVAGQAIVFRTAPDTLLAVHAHGPMSFEVDRIDEALRDGWSVLVTGHAHEVSDEREISHLERSTGLEPWASGARDVWVRIAPAQVSGRIIQPC
jgi:nitroimidazol reductase NimA-like FMN-containing flavoprotein (pyridoxamine 5'-phosphate oxidase superfamily)